MSAARRAETSRPTRGQPLRIVGEARGPAVQRLLPLGWYAVVGTEPESTPAHAVGVLTPDTIRALADAGLGVRIVVEAEGAYKVVVLADGA